MPSLSTDDVLVGKIALAKGTVTRPQLDRAIGAIDRGEASNLGSALVHSGVLSRDDLKSIMEMVRRYNPRSGPSDEDSTGVRARLRPSDPPRVPPPPGVEHREQQDGSD